MPINYSNSIIYKVVCNDLKITECYVGSTCNFKCRKNQHKNTCNNENSKSYNMKIYSFIRTHGGWDNWTMVPIFKYTECKDKMDLHIMEGKYIKELKASLNSQIQGRTGKEYYIDNKDRLLLQMKQQYEDNKEERLLQCKIYRGNNKDKIKEDQKIYRGNNKESIKIQRKEFRKNNKEKLALENKQWREKNKEQIKLKASQKITCICGSIITKNKIPRHKRTEKHLNFIAD